MPVKRILLAEDDKDDRFFFTESLKHRDDFFLMPIAENGADLMEFLEAIHPAEFPDVIILDQNMPRQNGLQTLKLLKGNDTYSHIPLVVYSASTNDMLIRQSLESGALLVVNKPSTLDEYNKMIDDILQVINGN
ncbi:MAG TPA: response regulator [Flavipsychrobacter sp.]|nr:response regulator [Flavipsychrobacter sp.]